MAVCNTSLPWKHFRRAIKFTACQSGHKTRDQSLIAGNGYASLYSVPVRPYGTSRRKSILGEAEGRPTIKRVPIQRGGRSNERQGLRRNSSAQRCQIHTGATQKPTPQEHASLIAKVRRSLSEKHLVEAPQAQELRMCTVLAESPQNTVRTIVYVLLSSLNSPGSALSYRSASGVSYRSSERLSTTDLPCDAFFCCSSGQRQWQHLLSNYGQGIG